MAPPAVVEAVSGAAAGCVALIATYPLMTVSTQQATRSKRLQAQLPLHKKEKANAFGTIEDIAEVCALWLTNTLLQFLVPSQAIDCTLRATLDSDVPHLQIVRESGWQGLFQGLQASLVGTAVSQVWHPHLAEERSPSLAMQDALSRDSSCSGCLRIYYRALQAVYFYFYSLLRKAFVARLQRLKQTTSEVCTVQPACPPEA